MNMPLNIDWQQILLHLFNFAVLFGVLYFLLYSPVKSFMEKREEYYKDIDDKAKANLKEAEDAKAEYLNKLTDAENEISAKKAEAHKSAENAYQAKIDEAEAEAAKIVTAARAQSEKEKQKMIDEAQKEIVSLATAAAEKLAVGSTTSEAYDMFLDSMKGSEKDEQC